MRKDNTGEYCLLNINEKISQIWDRNVLVRAEDLENGTDYSYINIIKPFVLEQTLLFTTASSRILDIGCGCGYLTNAIYEEDRHSILGIDLSADSIAYSKNKYPYINFIHRDVYCMPRNEQYDLCLAIMTLNNMPDAKAFFSIVHGLLETNGRLVAVIPHPCFWPLRHLDHRCFSYSDERYYEIPFATKGRTDYLSSILYFHRTIELYMQCVADAGFYIGQLKELSEEEDKKSFPDILGFTLKKCDKVR